MKHLLEFGEFLLDTDQHLLLREDRSILLAQKVYETLLVLVKSNGRVLTKDELMLAIWPDTLVEEVNLAHNISELRKVLGDSPERSEYIQTIPRRGYRFVAEVRESQEIQERVESHTLENDQLRENGGVGESVLRRSSRTSILIASITVLGLLIVFGYLWLRRSEPAQRLTTLAILPFKPLVATDSDESLELGMAETLIAKLSSLREITVRPVSSVRKFSGLEQDPVAAGKEIKVDAILDGTIQRTEDRIRMTVRLLSVHDGKTLWVATFDEKFTDIFAVQDAVSQRVVEALAFRLRSEDVLSLTKRYTEDVEAYRLYLKGQYFWNKFTPEAADTSVEYFNQALERDPHYALAYAGMANAYSVMGANGWRSPKEAFPKAQAAAAKALEIDDGLAEAHSTMGATEMFYNWNWQSAERELQRAIELSPDNPNARRLYSYLLTATGRFDEAIAQAELNRRHIDPLSPVSYADLVRAFYFARRYDEAVEANHTARKMDPNFPIALTVAAASYEQQGKYEQAIAELQRAETVSGRSTEALAALGHVLAVAGKRDEALKTLNELTRMSGGQYVSPLDLALLYAGLQDKERTLEQLEHAADDRVGWLINLGVEPRFQLLRSEPRYMELLRRMRLAN